MEENNQGWSQANMNMFMVVFAPTRQSRNTVFVLVFIGVFVNILELVFNFVKESNTNIISFYDIFLLLV